MKLVFLVSDVVLMGLISSFTTLASIVVIAVVNAGVKRIEAKQKMTSEKTLEGVSKIDQIAEKQDVIHKQIDGRMEDLLKINKEASEAIGKLKGIAEQKSKEDSQEKHKNGEESSNQ